MPCLTESLILFHQFNVEIVTNVHEGTAHQEMGAEIRH